MAISKTLKQRWITALTDGSFHHYYGGFLVDKENYNKRCCLGVMRAISGKSVINMIWLKLTTRAAVGRVNISQRK